MDTRLQAFMINCTLKPAPEPSSGDVLGAQVLDALAEHGVAAETLRAVDHRISPGVGADGRPTLFDKVAIPVVVGNEDGAHHISAVLAQALGDVGFTIPAQAAVYWNGEAMQKTDYRELDSVPEPVAAATATAAANAAHLARLLRAHPYPA